MELTIQLGDLNRGFQLRMQTDCGDRAQNQDAIDCLDTAEWLVCALADGAGGHQGGEVASRYAVADFLSLFSYAPTQDTAQLIGLLQQVNNRLLSAQQSDPALADMHTTFCALVMRKHTRQALWLHVGDSRIYYFRQHQLLSRTKDHSILQWMLDREQPLCSNRNALYSALGEQANHLQIEVSTIHHVKQGDWFLLCSDGLWEHFTEQELGLLGSNLGKAADCCSHVHQLALSRAKGRADNLSSIMLFIE